MKSRIWWPTACLALAVAIAVWALQSIGPGEATRPPQRSAHAGGATEQPRSEVDAGPHVSDRLPLRGVESAGAASAIPPAAGLIVHVQDPDARPVAGIPVHWTAGSTSEWHSDQTASSGQLVIEYPLGSSFLVDVAGQTKAASNATGPARVDFVVWPFRRIAVLVTDPQHRPVSDAAIQLGSVAIPQATTRVGVTGDDGRASVFSYHERDLLSVDKAGWRPSRRLPVIAAKPPQADDDSDGGYELRFTIEPLRSSDVMSGRVTDEYGRPIAGAHIHWHAETPLRRHRGFLSRGPLPIEVVADGAGSFAIRLCGQSGRLQVSATGFAERWIALAPEGYESAGLPDIVLEPATSVTGTILDQAGRAISGARVRAVSSRPVPPETLSDASGRFILGGLTSGTDTAIEPSRPGVAITAFHNELGFGSTWAGVATGERTDVTIVLTGNGIEGTVRRGSTPVAGARVQIRGTVGDPQPRGWAHADYHVETRDPDGAFTITRPSSGTWELLVEPPREANDVAVAYALPGEGLQTPVDIDLDLLQTQRGTLVVRIVDSRQQPVDTYYLRLVSTEKSRRALSILCTARDGRTRVAVPGGEYEVYVSPAGGGVAHRVDQVRVLANRTLDLGDFAVAEPGSIHGTLEGVSNERSELIAHVTAAAGRLTGHVWTGGFGDWQIEHLAPGRYTIRPSRASQIDFDATTVEVHAGAQARVQLVGHPCWQGSVLVRLPGEARGYWLLRYRDCHGQMQQTGFEVHSHSEDHAVARVDGVHLWRGTSTISLGPTIDAMQDHEVETTDSNLLWIDAR